MPAPSGQPLKLAYLTSHYARASDSFIRGEVEQLRRLGCEVHTFSIRRPDEGESVSEEIERERRQTEDILCQPLGVLATSVLLTLMRSPWRFLGALRLAWKCSPPGIKARLLAVAYTCEAAHLARRLRALKIDHLHNHIGEASATVTMLAGRLSGVPYSLTIHGPNEFDKASLMALDEKLAHAAFVVAISHFGRSQLYRWTRWQDWPKIHVVRCGVDETFLEATPEPIPDSPRLVSIGRLAEQKGQLLLVEAAAQLIDQGVNLELRLIGDGPMRSHLESLIAQRGLGENVKLLGWMSDKQIRQEILQSRALVLPSFAEGLPVVLMEALALRRPVVTTTIAGIPELVEDGVNGWLVPAGDRNRLAEAIREMLLLPDEELERRADEGAERVRELHNAATEARRLLNLFEASVSAGGRGITTDSVSQHATLTGPHVRRPEAVVTTIPK